ncbi:ABC transporter permease [Metabacillus endolithicus]|uniref:Transport permease protein n=1 Tax=Metabacillus endolithicus TaxID=1535204 RepID=A0ABW5BS89_9BACI
MVNTIFRSMLVTSLRDKITLFYSFMFPLALIIGLGFYFDDGEMPVKIVSGVTAISTIFWGMQGIAFQVHFQRNKGVYKFLKLTPMPTMLFVSIMILARTVIGIVVNMVVWGFGMLFLQIDITFGSFLTTFLLIVIGTLCFTSIGFVISNLANNEGQINMYSNLLQLPMIFMSQAFYSLQNAPDWVKIIGKLLPFEHYVKGLRNAITLDGSITLAIIIPLAFMIGSLVLSTYTFKWESSTTTMTKKSKKFA